MTPGPEAGHAEGTSEETKCHIFVYGKYQDPLFQKYRVCAQYLAHDRRYVDVTVTGHFETQYEQTLRQVVNQYAGSFVQSKPSMPLVFAEVNDTVLYFLNDKRFFDWAYKRFGYEDRSRLVIYKRVGNKAQRAVKDATGRSYCAIGFCIGDQPQETVHFELFDEECPELTKNFLELLKKPAFNGHLVHRVKGKGWVQAGDLSDSSGLNSEAARGGLLRHESFKICHDRAGLLGMADHGKDTIGSQFYITLRELPFLDGKSVIFGRVISGMRTINVISKVATCNERPKVDVKVCAAPEHTSVGAMLK